MNSLPSFFSCVAPTRTPAWDNIANDAEHSLRRSKSNVMKKLITGCFTTKQHNKENTLTAFKNHRETIMNNLALELSPKLLPETKLEILATTKKFLEQIVGDIKGAFTTKKHLAISRAVNKADIAALNIRLIPNRVSVGMSMTDLGFSSNFNAQYQPESASIRELSSTKLSNASGTFKQTTNSAHRLSVDMNMFSTSTYGSSWDSTSELYNKHTERDPAEIILKFKSFIKDYKAPDGFNDELEKKLVELRTGYEKNYFDACDKIFPDVGGINFDIKSNDSPALKYIVLQCLIEDLNSDELDEMHNNNVTSISYIEEAIFQFVEKVLRAEKAFDIVCGGSMNKALEGLSGSYLNFDDNKKITLCNTIAEIIIAFCNNIGYELLYINGED